MQWLPEAVFRYRVRGENAIKYLVYYFNRKITQKISAKNTSITF